MLSVTRTELLHLVETRLGEKCVNVLVPKDNPNWHGPWNCAELVSWLVYQKLHALYGCIDNYGNPATTEAYSGAWAQDASTGILLATDQATANKEAGVVLVRQPLSRRWRLARLGSTHRSAARSWPLTGRKSKGATANSILSALNNLLRDDLRAGMKLLKDTHEEVYQALREASQVGNARYEVGKAGKGMQPRVAANTIGGESSAGG